MKSIKSICASMWLIHHLAVLASPFTNGSFERPGVSLTGPGGRQCITLSPDDTRLAGWTIGSVAGSSGIGVRYSYANIDFTPVDGAYHLVFYGRDPQTQKTPGTYISQTFDTLTSQDYAVTFYVGGFYNGDQTTGDARLEATATSDTGVKLALLIVDPPSKSYGYGTQQRFVFTATSEKTTLTFLDVSTIVTGNGEAVALDAVDVAILAPTIQPTPPVLNQQAAGLGSKIVHAPPGLVGWWPGDGNAKDFAGTNHGILVNASTRPGYVGEAFAFSGQNSYVQIPSNPAIDSVTNALTLEAWVWHDATGATIQRYVTLTPDKAILYFGGSIKFELHTADGAIVPLTSGISVEPRKWYHVAGTYDGKEQRLYINGARVGVAVVNRPTGWTPGNSDLDISIAGQAMNGLVDEVAVYNRALTAEEIQSHFSAGSAGMAKAPVFSAIGVFFPGNARLSIKGQAGKAVTIQSSSNLLDWVTLTTDQNSAGTVNFIDSSAGTVSHRFYRAVGN